MLLEMVHWQSGSTRLSPNFRDTLCFMLRYLGHWNASAGKASARVTWQQLLMRFCCVITLISVWHAEWEQASRSTAEGWWLPWVTLQAGGMTFRAPTIRQRWIQNAEYTHTPRCRCDTNNHLECRCRAPMSRLAIKAANVLASDHSYLPWPWAGQSINRRDKPGNGRGDTDSNNQLSCRFLGTRSHFIEFIY